MTENEYLERLEIQQLYQPNHQTVLKSTNMPSTPVAPKTLVQEVTKFLTSKNVFISDDTPTLIEEICKVFNYCIECNTKGFQRSFVYPAQTGSGKSVSLKVYVSLLQKESSLIVVSKVEEAIQYCEIINELSQNPDYARCYYTITDKNKDSNVRVEKHNLKNHRCIVISHSMFKLVNQKVDADAYKLYKKKQRDLIVIDEKVSFYEQYEFSNKDLDKLLTLVAQINMKSETIKEFIEENKLDLEQRIIALQLILEQCTNALNSKEKPIILIEKSTVEEFFDNELKEDIKLIIEDRINEIIDELTFIGNVSNSHYETSLNKSIDELLDNITNVFEDDFFYYKSNHKDAFVRVENIMNKLGANVVLDATANINEFYQVANRYAGNVVGIDARQIRKYNNLTIYKAKGFPQSRSKTYKTLSKEEVKAQSKMYISYANSILEKEEDKLLIISFKDFKVALMEETTDERINFTHWGDHIGKNDWSDCNKVMIVGWYFLDPLVHISTIINAVNDNTNLAVDLTTNDAIKNFEDTQLADDLVQAVMRSKARIISNKDSDCRETDIYLFYEEKHQKVLDIFESQFPEANIIDWAPIGMLPIKKKSGPEKKVDKIINHLKEKEKTHQTYLLKDLIKETGIHKTTMNRLVKLKYLEEQLTKNGYSLKNFDGKSKHFILK